jgi:Ca-activated chloride channel family protein
MTFEWPFALVFVLLVPLFGALYALAQRSRRRDGLRYSSIALVGLAVGKGPGRKRHVPAALYLLAIGFVSLALARPQMKLPALERSATIILVLDLSGSMRADDIKPTRIDAATNTIRDFVKKQPQGVKIGLVGFAQQAQVLNEPTEKKDLVLRSIANVYLQRGTNIGDGLQLAMDVLLAADGVPLQTAQTPAPGAAIQRPPRATVPARTLDPGAATIILLSDGASTTGPPPLNVAKDLAHSGVKVYTVGLGALSSGAGPSASFFSLDEPTLRGIADATGGRYYPARDASELHHVYGELARETSVESRYAEATWVMGGIAAVLMVMAGVLGLLWTNRLP